MLIVDTGVLLAAADDADPDHQACARLLADADGPLITTPLLRTWALVSSHSVNSEAVSIEPIGASLRLACNQRPTI